MTDTSRSTVFISYSHHDRVWLERLRAHLKPLERAGLVDAWDDSRIRPGMQWRDEIERAVRSARAAVLLVSPDFLASDFVQSDELAPLLEAAERDGVRILPLIVRPCRYAREPALARFQAVNDPEKPLSELRPAQRDRLLDQLSHAIEEALAAPAGRGPDAAGPVEAREWVGRLNRAFAGAVAIHRVVRQEPRIVIEGPLELTPELREAAARRRAEFPSQRMTNDLLTVLSKPPVWSDNPVVLTVRTLDFAEVGALRRLGEKPALLSGNALVFCEETRELLLHRRAEDSQTYPGALHTLGGGYIPPGMGHSDDQHSLVNTARREVLEESKVSLAWETPPPMLLSTELTTGFVQFVLLGVNVSRYDIERASPNREGTGLSRVPFDELHDSLAGGDSPDPAASHTGWVPSGKAHVLTWLALGAPGAKSRPRFGRHSPAELFDTLVGAAAS